LNYLRWVNIFWLLPLIAGLLLSCGTGASSSSEKGGSVVPNLNSNEDVEPITCADIIFLMITYSDCEAACYSAEGDPTNCDAGCQEDFMTDYVDNYYGSGGCIDDLLASGGAQEEFFDCFATYCGDCFSTCSDELYSCVSDASSCFTAFGTCLSTQCDQTSSE